MNWWSGLKYGIERPLVPLMVCVHGQKVVIDLQATIMKMMQ